MKRWIRRLLGAIAVTPLCLACALVREGNPVTAAGAGYGPCKSWVYCGEANGPGNRCCPPREACAVDSGGPYCAADEGRNGGEPVTWGRKVARHPRYASGQ